jgi:PAS domain S-box-containing protein
VSPLTAAILGTGIPCPPVLATHKPTDRARMKDHHASGDAESLKEARLLTLVEQLRDHAVFMIGRDGINLTWNEGVRRLLGYAEEEFVGRPAADLFTPEDREAGVPARELAYAAEHGSASDERWLVRKDGSRLWASGVTTRLDNSRGNLVGFGKVFRDLTAEREFQEIQRRSEERYRLAMRATREAIWDRDLSTQSITWSDGLELLFGYRADEIGPDVAWWEERIHPDDRERVTSEIREAVLGGQTFWEGEYRFRRKSGEYALVEDRGYVMRSSDGLPFRMLGSIADVTERRRAEEALRQAQRLEAVGQLAGGIAHDLNNMLVAIIGYSDLVARSMAPGDPSIGSPPISTWSTSIGGRWNRCC